MNIVPRSEWADRPPARTVGTIATPTPRLWLHHGAAGTSTVATVRSYLRHHIVNRGWADIAYSFVVAEGKILEGRGAGKAGAHTAGDNSRSHGICVAGSYTTKRPADRDLDALVWLIRHGHQRGWWPARLTGGHRDAPGASTACPGGALQALIPEINTRSVSDEEEAKVLLTRIDNSNRVYQVVGHALVALTSAKQAEAIAKLAGWSGRWQDHVGNLTSSQASAFRQILDLHAGDGLDQIAADSRYAAKGHGHTVRLD